MKKYALIGAATISLAVAGGDILPAVEVPVEVPVQETVSSSTENNFYVGLGYSYLVVDADREETGNAITLQAGYKFHEYLSAEFRYTRTIGDEMEVSGLGDLKRLVSNKALFLKPHYSLTEELDVYALVGYGEVIARNTSGDGFQWGIGAEYLVSNDIGIFVDYTSVYDDTLESVTNVNGYDFDTQVSATTFGVKYHF